MTGRKTWRVGISVLCALLPVAPVTSEARASGRVDASTRASVTWVARTLKSGSSAKLGSLISTTSTGEQRWSASGSCSISGSRVLARKSGTCSLTVSIARTATAPALSSTRTLPVLREVTIDALAAASLSGAFERIGTAFTAQNRHVKLSMSYAGSATLVTQIQQGAPFNVVATADQANMLKLVAGGHVDASSTRVFAMNRLAMLVAKGNPLRIRTIADAANPSIGLSLCDPAQPCGKYAAQMFAAAGINVKPATLETSASGVVGRVAAGEADVGIAYASDGVTTKAVTAVEIPVAQNVIAKYPVALASGSAADKAAAAHLFRSFLLSPTGRALLTASGFIAP